jgi:hypothetical protein
VQHRALREGVALATVIGENTSVMQQYTKEAEDALCFLQVSSIFNPE